MEVNCQMQGRRKVPILILAFVLVTACERMETVEEVYATLGDAVKAGAVGDEKRIPEFLPSSATEIRAVYNIDSNEVWLSFRFSPAEVNFMVPRCRKITEDMLRWPRKPISNWWPEALVQGTKKTPSGSAYQHYECGTKSFLSVDSDNKVAYYWALG
jgi:hypothetical protein